MPASAARLGDGRTGVVFADDSDDDPCSWRSEAQALAKRGFAVTVFKAGGGDEARQALTIANALRRTGPQHIVLIGASVGAGAVLQAGAMHPRHVDGLVALSAERRISTNPSDLLPQVKRIDLPLLSVGSRTDPLTRFGSDTQASISSTALACAQPSSSPRAMKPARPSQIPGGFHRPSSEI